MNVKEFYVLTNSNYQSALSLMMNDMLIERMITKFMSDNSIETMISLYENKDFRNLFATSHALKGVAGNLALTKVYELACTITEATRNSDDVNLDKEISELKETYSLLKEAFQKCA